MNKEDFNIELNKKVAEFNFIIETFTDFSKKQILQSFLIDEIESTNKIENIISTKHDIFSIINNVSTSNDEIIKDTGVSKRILIYTLNKFKDNDLLDDIKIGKYTFHKIKENTK